MREWSRGQGSGQKVISVEKWVWAFGQEMQVRHSIDCRDVHDVRNGKGHGGELRGEKLL